MKGKKIDNTFVANFISESVSNGKFTTNEIVNSAKNQIKEIDQKIIEVENLKKIRSKLLDVIIVFDRNYRQKAAIDNNLINFYQIKDKNLASSLCEKVFIKNNLIDFKKNFPSTEEIQCMKQLLEFNILQKTEDIIKAGENFHQFKTFLKENYEINR
jgi:hypothetical protein